jgi:type III pantothenate kinase
LALRGALSLLPSPLLVVSAGTALTLDAVDADGHHLGGLILAGIQAQAAGLLQRAPHLEAGTAPPGPRDFWARDTREAVAHAPWQAAAGLIERALRKLERASGGGGAGLVLAGGDAARLAPLIEAEALLDPELVLRGLALAAAENDAD